MSNLTEKITIALIGVILVIVVAGMITAGSSFAESSDSATLPQDPTPFNITLTQDYPQTLLNVSNGTLVLDASNYTSFISEGIVQINDNNTWTGTVTVDYNYRQSNWMPATVVVVLFAALVLIVIAIGMKAIGKGNKR